MVVIPTKQASKLTNRHRNRKQTNGQPKTDNKQNG